MKKDTTTVKQMAILFSIALGFLGIIHVNAQTAGDLKFCGTNEMLEKAFRENPKMKIEFEARHARMKQEDAAAFAKHYSSSRVNSAGPPTYLIPIVFHVVHDYGSENISDAQIIDEVRILNEDYRKRNADTSAVDSVFRNTVADIQIEFRLARLDPNGKCTNGIDRIPSLETYIGDESSKLNDWPSSKYLNVWVVKTIANGAAGYAYLPGTCPPNVDGILILSSYIGSIGSGSSITCRALTHEIGHFLDLEHTWGSTNSPGVQCGDDGVSDTPITKGWNHCPSPSSSMLCNPGVEENYQNYMDYSYCTHMFTLGQANRMISALTSSTAQRNNLITNANLASTGVSTPFVVCAPKPDIIPNVPVMLCAGDSYTYKYYASNGHPTSWSWVFQGGTPGTSTDSVPVIQYLTPGTYSVTLTLSNASGSGNITKTNYVIVIPSATQYTGPQYTEGFENASSVMNDWTLINLQGNPWTRVTTAAATGSASFRLTNLNNTMGEIASAVSPTINLVNIPNAVLTFKLAFAQTATTNTDKFVMSISTDCGKTWIQRYRKAGTTLATAPVTTSSFVPTSTQWRTETANLAPYWGNSEVRFRFDMQNGGGNNIYLDNINIASPSTGIAEQLAGFSDFNIYPNPTEGNSLIAFSLKEATRLTIKVYDVVGKEVALIVDQNLDAGNHEYTFSAHEQLRSGMYFVTALIGNSSLVTQKLIVK